ncbi:MAG: ATP-binding protein [Patescibacteria group bacterium]
MSVLTNLDLFSVGIAVAAIGILGFIIFFSNRRSATNRAFLIFSISSIVWGISNYLNSQFQTPEVILWVLRFHLFISVWYAFFLFRLLYVFPNETAEFTKFHKFVLLPFVALTSIITLTPLVFSHIIQIAPVGQVTNPERGPGIIVFAGIALYLVVGAIFFLLRKMIKAKDVEKRQFRYVFEGIVAMFSLIMTFNLILPVFFNEVRFIPLGAIFILPFVTLTTYAIIKEQLLNVKVVATEILTFVLAIVTLLEVILSKELGVLIFRISTFLLVLSFGILLIRSVRKEVEQREQLQKLTVELERANEELKRLDKAKSEFVSIASHQLRTPLTASKGYLSLILEGTYGALEEKLKKPLRSVYNSNERLIHLVNDLLSLSRIESGKMKLELESTDIGEIAKSVVDELQLKAEEKGLKLVLKKLASGSLQMQADKEKIRNVILNLIDNAIHYTKQGSITTTVAEENNQLHLAVQDTGEGMTEEEIAKLFKSFSRGEAGEKLSTEGAGLGLYIAKQFVEMHKGKIWATSSGKGKGSTFHVEIPTS